MLQCPSRLILINRDGYFTMLASVNVLNPAALPRIIERATGPPASEVILETSRKRFSIVVLVLFDLSKCKTCTCFGTERIRSYD